VRMNAGARTITGAHGFDPLVQVSGDVVLSSVKLADDRSGDLVVRVYEPSGRRGTGGIAVSADEGTFGAAVEVSLLEEPFGAEASSDAAASSFAVDAYEVRTFRFPRN
jgi:alpha-mannosidase